MSTRQIGAALGVTYATVQRDMQASDTHVSDEPRRVQSSDGITRTYTGYWCPACMMPLSPLGESVTHPLCEDTERSAHGR